MRRIYKPFCEAKFTAVYGRKGKTMKKYSESDNAAAMLMDYTNYMMKYADTMEKLDQIKSEELTLQEEQYYIEVMARIQKKLLETSQ